ncbi:MAG: hypothetical protein IJ187_03400 [Neisseriaceae bacterium]|nr:hypothetical protein [Neisseriaceae bacterium]
MIFKRQKRKLSIRARLLWALFINLPLVWLFAILTSSWSLYNNINQINDTQMSQLARRMLTVPYFYDGNWHVPQLEDLIEENNRDQFTTFAVWHKDGTLLLADRGSYFLQFIPPEDGYHDVEFFHSNNKKRTIFNRNRQPEKTEIEQNQEQEEEIDLTDNDLDQDNIPDDQDDRITLHIDDNARAEFTPPKPANDIVNEHHIPFHQRTDGRKWRVLRLTSPDGSTVVAVGQNKSVRFQAVNSAIKAQLIPWILALPLLLLALSLSMRISLRPLNNLARHLNERSPQDDSPLEENVPREMKPLTHALNHLFGRVQETIQREQRFTSDAAHELRSPLAALKVQAEVLAMSDTEEEQNHALGNIFDGINRSERLIGQLLALARLDNNTGDMPNETIDWQDISEKVLQNAARAAREKHIQLKREVLSGSLKEVLPLTGNPTLIELMLRNLIDNAIRYTPENGEVTLAMGDDFVRIIDNGRGIAPEHLSRIKERFFRPPGQKESGSGLGMSIIDRIATLHGLTFILQNRETGGLKAEVRMEKTSD